VVTVSLNACARLGTEAGGGTRARADHFVKITQRIMNRNEFLSVTLLDVDAPLLSNVSL